jgi:sulfur-carrier protein adenylyltransferase/sulfurtransferase
MPTIQDLLAQTKKQISEIKAEELKSWLDQKRNVTLVDVREKDEQDRGVIPNAVLLPRGFLELQIENKVPQKDQEVVLYCAGGNRSALAAKSLQDLGYKKVHSLIGGYTQWANNGYATLKKKSLRPDQLERYARHIMMPEVGEEGQIKLLESKVFIVGAGGLGSPSAYYLAAAGVGTIGIIDHDVVDRTNLQRQILHNEARVGEPKVESAKKTLTDLNPDINVVTYREKLSRDNIMNLIKDYDIIVNGCDNFPTRYLVNDACVFSKKPLVDGSIFRFEGQVCVFDAAKGGPCYRCLYPEPPPPEMAPSCADAGVFGALPGIVGTAQAVEVIKLILGKGEPLIGRLLTFDALKMKFKELKIRRDKDCPVSGDHPTTKELIDYDWFCSMAGGDPH